MAYEQLAQDVLRLVGGKDNVTEATHCFTRLRFKLADESLADRDALKQLDGVTGVVEAGGQFQVVVGTQVGEVFAALEPLLGELAKGAEEDEASAAPEEEKRFSLKGVINTFASIFTPTIPALAGAGIIKGLLVLFKTLGWLDSSGSTYMILTAASDSVFYFMPIILGYSAAKKFKCDPVIAMAVGGALIYPDLVEFMSEAESVTFLGLPVIVTTYSSTVIPIILATWVQSKLEGFLNRFIPAMVKSVIVPAITLFVMVPATLMIFGPFGNYASELVGDFFTFVTEFSPLLAGAFFGGLYPVLVMFGMHRALVPLGVNEVATTGSTALWAFTGPSNFSQAGATLGAAIRIKDKKMRSVALSACVTALCGITEPALYGVSLKYKTPMIATVIAGAVGGAIAGVGGARAYAVAIPSLLTLPAFIGDGFVAFCIGCAVSFALAAVLTVAMGLKEE